MALDARSRASIYEKLVPLLGPEDANELMSQFPGREADELVTREHLRAEMGSLRAEMAALEARLTVRLGGAIATSTTLILGVTALLR